MKIIFIIIYLLGFPYGYAMCGKFLKEYNAYSKIFCILFGCPVSWFAFLIKIISNLMLNGIGIRKTK